MHIEEEKNIIRTPLSFKQGLLMTVLFLFFAVLLVFGHSLQFAYAQETYKLPYPGILPNHPLYRVKEFRDRLLEALTRDPIKKVELHLLFADKQIQAAQFLVDQHKEWDLAGKSALEAERHLVALKRDTSQAKEVGQSLEISLAERVRMVGPVHAKILKNLRKNAPKKSKQAFIDALLVNGEFSSWAKNQ